MERSPQDSPKKEPQMYDWQSHRPYGAPDQDGASRMFRNKPNQVYPGLQSALTQGSGTSPTQNAYESGGITGGNAGPVQAPPMVAPPPEMPASPPVNGTHPFDYKVLGQYANRLEGFDQNKLNSGHDSAKYQIGHVMSQFDPRQGITPELLDALNGLGGHFSGQGDKLHVDQGFGNLGTGTNLDVVRGFSDPNGSGGWQYGIEGDSSVPPPQMNPMLAQSALSSPMSLSPNVSTTEGSRSYLDDLMKQLAQNPALLRALQGGGQ